MPFIDEEQSLPYTSGNKICVNADMYCLAALQPQFPQGDQ